MLETAGGNDVSARVKLTAHLDDEHELRLTASDRSVRNGLSRNGVSVAFRRRGAFEAAYDVENDGPSFRFLSQADVLDRTVDLKYTHELRGKRTNTLEAGFDVDDKTRLHLKYDLTGGFDRPDLKSLSVRARYQHNDDWAVEPQYALGAESFSCAVEHRLDADNHVRAHYDQGANTGR